MYSHTSEKMFTKHELAQAMGIDMYACCSAGRVSPLKELFDGLKYHHAMELVGNGLHVPALFELHRTVRLQPTMYSRVSLNITRLVEHLMNRSLRC